MIDDYSPMTVTLASGRVLRMDTLLVQAKALPIDTKSYREADLPLLAKRNRLDWGDAHWYELDAMHWLIEDHETGSVESADRVLVTALLYSAPIGSAGGFSELMVTTYVNWKAEGSFHLTLQRILSGLDWEALAVDRPLHTWPHSPQRG